MAGLELESKARVALLIRKRVALGYQKIAMATCSPGTMVSTRMR